MEETERKLSAVWRIWKCDIDDEMAHGMAHSTGGHLLVVGVSDDWELGTPATCRACGGRIRKPTWVVLGKLVNGLENHECVSLPVGSVVCECNCSDCGESFEAPLACHLSAMRFSRRSDATVLLKELKRRGRLGINMFDVKNLHRYPERLHEIAFSSLETMPYAEYLKTDHWVEIRKRVVKRAGGRCQLCWRKPSSSNKLNVHHKTYEQRGFEDDEHLIALCQECHDMFHKHQRAKARGRRLRAKKFAPKSQRGFNHHVDWVLS